VQLFSDINKYCRWRCSSLLLAVVVLLRNPILARNGLLGLCCSFTRFIYDCTVGPLAYAIVAEIPSTRLRQKTVVLARNTYNVGAIVCNVLITRQLNPGAWNWGAKAGFFWAGSCLLCFLWAYFRLPEPKGRSFVELDMLFEKRTPARLFRKTNIELQDFADRTCQKTIEAEPEHLEHSDNA
jgi:MFS family permease